MCWVDAELFQLPASCHIDHISRSELLTNWHYFVCNLLIFKGEDFTSGLLDKGYICVARQYEPAYRGKGYYKPEQCKECVAV